MKIACIADSITAKGLKLAGVKETREAEEKEEAEEAFEEFWGKEDVGIIIITEDLADKIGEKITETREEKGGITPILVEIPGRKGAVPERREVIDKLVKRAVGINVKE